MSTKIVNHTQTMFVRPQVAPLPQTQVAPVASTVQPVQQQIIVEEQPATQSGSDQTAICQVVLSVLEEMGIQIDGDSKPQFISGLTAGLNSLNSVTCKGQGQKGPCGQTGNFLNVHGFCAKHKSQDPDIDNLPEKVKVVKPTTVREAVHPCCAFKGKTTVPCASKIGLGEVQIEERRAFLCTVHKQGKNVVLNEEMINQLNQ
jgi:hypothetical protein